jgi:hypothetical protein
MKSVQGEIHITMSRTEKDTSTGRERETVIKQCKEPKRRTKKDQNEEYIK